jgi:hypothetical protein
MGYNLLKENLRDINDSLRKWFDGDDPIFKGFRFGGFQRNGGRGGRRTPAWAANDAEIKRVLLRSFPKLHTDSRQRAAAARWMLIIHMYWRRGLTHGTIVWELNECKWGEENSPELWNLNKVRSLIHRISRAAEKLNGRSRGRVPHNPGDDSPRVQGWIEAEDGNRIEPRALEIPVHKLGRPPSRER